jgi:ABC-2 type transport system permease protein
MRHSVITRIARHQLRAYARDWRILLVAPVLLCLYGLSLWSGWRTVELAHTEGVKLEREERRRWLNQGVKSPHAAADQGVVAAQPLLPLAAFDPGVLSFAGQIYRLEGHHEELAEFRPAADATALFRIAWLTPARVVQVFVPLLMILLIYPVVSAERESGMLRQILATGVSGRQLLAGQLGAVAAALAPLILLMLFAGPALVSSGDWARAAALSAGHLAYLAALAGVFAAIAARSSSAGQTLSRLVACWFVAVMLGPVVASHVAAWLAPVPHPMEWSTALREEERAVPTVEERRKAVRARLLHQHGLTELRDLPVNPVGVELVEEDRDLHRIWGSHIDDLYRLYARQDQVYAIAGLLDPMLAIQTWSAAITGSDNDARATFRQAVERYRRHIVFTMNDYLVHDPHYHTNPVYVGTDIIVTTAGRELWDQIPPFRYDVPSFHASGWSLAGLLLWGLFGFGLLACTRPS